MIEFLFGVLAGFFLGCGSMIIAAFWWARSRKTVRNKQ